MENIEGIVKKYTSICIDRCFNPWILTHKEALDQNELIEYVYGDNYLGEYGSTQLGDIIFDEMSTGEKRAIINDFWDVDSIYYGKDINEDHSPALSFLDNVESKTCDVLSDMDLTVEEYVNQIER